MGFSILKGSTASLQFAVPPHTVYALNNKRGTFLRSPAFLSNTSSRSLLLSRASKEDSGKVVGKENISESASKSSEVVGPEEEEEYEEETWLEEKIGDVYEFTSTAVQSVPGPRVSGIPWLVAAPAAYLGISFVWSIIRLIQKYNSARFKKRRQVGKNALLCEKLDEYFSSNRLDLTTPEFTKLVNKFGFPPAEILRKYIRYALNEHPFGLEVVADLIHLKNVSQLTSLEVAEVLNDISARVVKAKGAIMMDTEGMTEKGIKRKAAVQAIFTKLYYLSEVEEFCASAVRSKLQLKEIFGITDEDAESIKIEILSEGSDVASLEKILSKDLSDGSESDSNDTD